MSASRPDAQRHAARLQQLSRPGQPLGPDTPYASARNPAWFLQNGRPRAQRVDLHNQLLTRWQATSPSVAQGRQALLLAGPPGAGKSTAQRQLADAITVPLEQWRIVNSDDFKDLLLEQALADRAIEQLTPPELRGGERIWPRELAAIVHQESAYLANRALAITIAAKENVILDGTLSNAEKARDLVDHLARNGYTVRLASVDGPEPVIRERIAHRWRTDYLAAEEGTAQGATAELGGRWVPSEVPNDLYDRADESRCATVARDLAAASPAVVDHYAYRVERADAAPELITHTGRAQAGAAQLSGSELSTARLILPTQPHRSQGPRRAR